MVCNQQAAGSSPVSSTTTSSSEVGSSVSSSQPVTSDHQELPRHPSSTCEPSLCASGCRRPSTTSTARRCDLAAPHRLQSATGRGDQPGRRGRRHRPSDGARGRQRVDVRALSPTVRRPARRSSGTRASGPDTRSRLCRPCGSVRRVRSPRRASHRSFVADAVRLASRGFTCTSSVTRPFTIGSPREQRGRRHATVRLALSGDVVTGGDTISARELYGRRFNFEPSHKVVLVTNHRPRVHGTDHAIWRRLRVRLSVS